MVRVELFDKNARFRLNNPNPVQTKRKASTTTHETFTTENGRFARSKKVSSKLFKARVALKKALGAKFMSDYGHCA